MKVAVTTASGKLGGEIVKTLIGKIGRNGLYIEPDVEYIEKYKEFGKVANCAADGFCSYTTRKELAFAYTQMILNVLRF